MSYVLWLQMLIADGVEDGSIFNHKSEPKKLVETAVAPWVGYNEEETMKAQILALSKVVFNRCSDIVRLLLEKA